MVDALKSKSVDVVVVGAGFAGLHMLWKVRQLGLTGRIVEAEADVGGCWYANRYPGARCDVESVTYSYSFSDEVEREWRWSERYPPQAEIQRYLAFVADRLDLRRDIEFSARVEQALFDDATGRWTVTCANGSVYSTHILILAAGPLTIPKMPDVPGAESFKGQSYHTARWPREGANLAGKRVGLIGTGSSGAQFIPAVADLVEKLSVFIRTPNYVLPARNRELTTADRAYWESHKAELKAKARRMEVAGGGDVFSFESLRDIRGVDIATLTEEERQEIMETCWQAGGPAPLIFAFANVYTDAAVNEIVSRFIISKISDTITDPVLLETLTPTGYPFLAKRPCVADGYYEAFLKPNVEAINVRANPIVRIAPNGVELRDGRVVPLDVIVYASGFDAMTGSLFAIDIRGRDGVRLADTWKAGPLTYLGVAVNGFPNLFILGGPGSPSVITNVVPTNEFQVDFLADLVAQTYLRGADLVEADANVQAKWVQHCQDCAAQTLFDRADSWYIGANVPGKPRVVLPYTGGTIAYQAACAASAEKGFEGFRAQFAAPTPG